MSMPNLKDLFLLCYDHYSQCCNGHNYLDYTDISVHVFMIYPPTDECIVYVIFSLFWCIFRYCDVFWADGFRKDLHHDRIHRII